MKLKSVAIAICSFVCAGAVWTGVNTATEYVSASETAVDISETTSISGWSTSAELKLLTISFGYDALGNFDYNAMDTEAYAYIQEYLYFNGKSVKEINADTSLGALNWAYTQFPGNASDKYKVPVLIYERDAQRLRLYIHENYFNALGANPTFEIKEGLEFVNDAGATSVMGKTRKFSYSNGAWVEPKEEKDITANVTISGWNTTGSASELIYTKINFGAGVLPSDLGYHILDSDIGTQYHYIKDYITINGKTVGQINEETDVSNYVFSSFPSTAADKYKLPVILFGNGDNLEVKIHKDYIASLGENTPIVIGVKEGLTFDGAYLYKVSSEVTALVYGTLETDISSGIEINGWDGTGDKGELTYTRINLGEGVLPAIGYGIIDGAYKYMQDYITINGRTVADINTNVDDSAYVYSTFPSTMDAYKVPVMIYVNAGKLEVKVHNDYIASLGENATITIGVKEGLSVENNGTKYVVKRDIAKVVYTLVVNTYTVTFMDGDTVVGTATYTDGQTSVEEPALPQKDGYTSAWEPYTLTSGDIVVNVIYTAIPVTDITANVTVKGWNATGDKGELTYTRINLGEGVMPAIGYGIIDGAYKYMQDYITINGRTVADINTNVDDSAYVYSTFPSTMDNYKVPVMIYVNEGTLEVKFHNDYIATFGENAEIIIGVKAGLQVEGENGIYKVMQDVAVTVQEKAVIVDVTANVTIGGWKMTGDLSELTRTTINLGEGVMPAGVDYGIMDNAKYGYLQDYITINGKTIREINAETDVSNYVFHTFPSTAADKYKIPVIAFVNGDNIELKIHNDYLASLGGNIDVIVGVKAGLSIVNGSATYTVTENVSDYARRKAYTLTVELNPGMDEQYLTMGSEIVLEAPQREHYVFVGWFEKGTDNEALTVMPERDYTVYAKYTAIEYTITFVADGATIDTLTYTVADTAIAEPTIPEKAGYGAKWEEYTLDGGNKVVNAIYTAGVSYVIFKADGKTVATLEYTVENKDIAVPEVPAKAHYTGVWEAYELTTGYVTVNAIYTAIEYTVTFMNGETVVATDVYTVENTAIAVPEVPAKEHYTVVWEAYELNGGNVTVNAIYTANEYTVTFVADGETIDTITYTVEDKAIAEPVVPAKEGYGAKWEEYTLDGGNKVVNAIYTAGVYTVTFKADGLTVEVLEYTVDNKEITEPEVPAKDYYTGAWETYELTTGDVTVNAIYTANEYTVTFMNGETVVGNATYTVENTEITEPEAPAKDGYTSAWETYELTGGDVVVNVEYTAIEYTVTFEVDGIVIGTATYTVENTEITEPAVPNKKNYTGVWNAYELTIGDVTVEATYTAIEYTVTFMDGDEVVATETYTVEDRNIDVPEVPTKEGYTSVWENFSLTDGDITVKVLYTLIEVEAPSDKPSDENSSSSNDTDSDDNSSNQDTTSSDDTSAEPDVFSKIMTAVGKLGCASTVSGISAGMVALAAAAVGLGVAFAVTLNLTFVAFAVVSAVLSAAAVLCWKNQTIVILDGDTFEYTTFLGKKIVYRFSEIESLRRNSDSFTLYVGGGKVHIESMAIMSDRLTDKINEAIARR